LRDRFCGGNYLRRDRVTSNCRQELPASQLASPACLETNPAMRVFARMSLTLVTADFAGASAGLQQRPGDVRVVLRLPADDLEGGITHIGAVQTQAHALDQPGQVLLGQVSVSVGGARFEAVVERINGGGQPVRIDLEHTRVGAQHLPRVAHAVLPLWSRCTDSIVHTRTHLRQELPSPCPALNNEISRQTEVDCRAISPLLEAVQQCAQAQASRARSDQYRSAGSAMSRRRDRSLSSTITSRAVRLLRS